MEAGATKGVCDLVMLSGTVYLGSDFFICFGLKESCDARRNELRANETYILDLDSKTCVMTSSGTSTEARRDLVSLRLQTPSLSVRRELRKRLHRRATIVGTFE